MNQTPADMMDFFGVNGAAQPPITRVRCPVPAWFGSKESDIGTDADLKRLRELIARHPQGPARVDTMILDGADHLHSGHEAQVAAVLANWIARLWTDQGSNIE